MARLNLLQEKSLLRALFVVMLAVAVPLGGAASARQPRSAKQTERNRQAKTQQQPDAPADLSYRRFDGPMPTERSKVETPRDPNFGGQPIVVEQEPNNTSATANAASQSSVMRGTMSPNADVDFWSFTAAAGDRVYAGVMTGNTPVVSAASSGNSDLNMRLVASDGTTVIEEDLNDGTFTAVSPGIAGAMIPSAGTYYIRVVEQSATVEHFGYELHLTVRSGSPTAEAEPNDSTATATPIGGGWVSGVVGPAAADVDFYSIALNAGESVYMSLDTNPERDAVTFDGRIGFGPFDGLTLIADDTNTVSPNSETFYWTVKETGTYFMLVDPFPASSGAATKTYNFSVVVRPVAGTGTTYPSADVPKSIGPAIGAVTTSTITIPDNVRIESLLVGLDLDMAAGTGIMQDLDVTLTDPQGDRVVLFDDAGSNTAGMQTSMNLVLDDDAAIPINVGSAVVDGMRYKPDSDTGRLDWFKGQLSAGTWTLTIFDDANATSGGTLNNWSLIVYAEPAPATCGPGTQQMTIFSTDFESGAAGFTHSGTVDEWELGTPTLAPINSANSGTNAWKTDLDGGYEINSSQDLLSPAINLSSASGPVYLNWAHRFQVENPDFDKYFVEVRQVGQPTGKRVFDHTGPTPSRTISSTPSVTAVTAVGWSQVTADISEFAGQTVEVRWHLETDDSVQFSGVAVDDVSVTACVGIPFDKDTLGLYTGGNVVFLKNLNTSGAADLAFGYGIAGDVAIAGDWDNDGDDSIGIYRASTGSFFLRNSNSAGSADITFAFGAANAGLIPLAGDWNGDGTDTIGLYDPATGSFFLRNTNSTGMADLTFMFGGGGAGIIPISGDWDGSGTDTIGLYVASSGVFFLKNTNAAGAADLAFMFGGVLASYQPIHGDWNNDNTDTIGLYDSSTGGVFLRNTNGPGAASVTFTFGSGGQTPITGDWDNLP